LDLSHLTLEIYKLSIMSKLHVYASSVMNGWMHLQSVLHFILNLASRRGGRNHPLFFPWL